MCFAPTEPLRNKQRCTGNFWICCICSNFGNDNGNRTKPWFQKQKPPHFVPCSAHTHHIAPSSYIRDINQTVFLSLWGAERVIRLRSVNIHPKLLARPKFYSTALISIYLSELSLVRLCEVSCWGKFQETLLCIYTAWEHITGSDHGRLLRGKRWATDLRVCSVGLITQSGVMG